MIEVGASGSPEVVVFRLSITMPWLSAIQIVLATIGTNERAIYEI